MVYVMKNPDLKWIMKRGTSWYQETSIHVIFRCSNEINHPAMRVVAGLNEQHMKTTWVDWMIITTDWLDEQTQLDVKR